MTDDEAPLAGHRRAAEVEWALAALGLDGSHRNALTRLAELGPPAEPVRLPPPVEAEALLERLGLRPPDLGEALTARPDRSTPGVWWLLERCHHCLVEHMGRPGRLGPWPTLSEAHGAVGRYCYVWVFLATLPVVRRYHVQRGIPDDTSWEILAALGAQMGNYRALYGVGGLHTQDWMTVHFRGLIYGLGRLYFERLPVWFDAPDDPGDGRRHPRKGDWSLGVHIPEGRLTPEACDASFARARAFFPRHFPEEDYRYATCASWVLDPQLAEYLSAETNIIRFAERFTLLPVGQENDSATVVEFVFRRPMSDLDELPRETTLQRAILGHIRAGRDWKFRTGWLHL
jgi:hypothetical protein